MSKYLCAFCGQEPVKQRDDICMECQVELEYEPSISDPDTYSDRVETINHKMSADDLAGY